METMCEILMLAQDAAGESSLGQWGQIGALIVIVSMFLKFLSSQSQLNRTTIKDIVAENSAQRELDRKAHKEAMDNNRQISQKFAKSMDKNTEFLARNEKALENVIAKPDAA